MNKKIGFFCLLLSVFIYEDVAANVIVGNINLKGKLADKAKLEDVVVYFVPDAKAKNFDVSPLEQPLNIRMKNKSYTPRVSVVTAGSEINIENADSILHNAFSPSRPNQFDLGLYKKSAGKSQVLAQPGVVKIFCNVHYHMVAYVLVLDTPYYTRVNRKGEFRIDNINGDIQKGKIYVWHERAKIKAKPISLPLIKKLNLELPITKRRIPEHKNKSGKSYKKKRRKRRY